MVRKIGVVKFKKIKFLTKAEAEARRRGLKRTAAAFKDVRFQIRSEARKGAIPEFKKPLIESPRQFSALPKKVRKQISTIEI